MARIIFIGDIVGRYARKFLASVVPKIKKKYKPDLIIANGENAAGGLGITKKTIEEIFLAGVDLITTGNHVWDKKEALTVLETETQVIRPLNFHRSVPGKGYCFTSVKDEVDVLVVNLQGRVFMEAVVDNPFTMIDDFLKEHRAAITIIDFHAEATAEKQAMGFFLDGRVSAVLGTHTHVQTTDLRILSGGTAYQSDVGMTGSLDSIIGMKREGIIRKFLTGINHRFEVERDNLILDMTVMDINTQSGRCEYVEAVRFHEETLAEQI